jgi:hypothetical protein
MVVCVWAPETALDDDSGDLTVAWEISAPPGRDPALARDDRGTRRSRLHTTCCHSEAAEGRRGISHLQCTAHEAPVRVITMVASG